MPTLVIISAAGNLELTRTKKKKKTDPCSYTIHDSKLE